MFGCRSLRRTGRLQRLRPRGGAEGDAVGRTLLEHPVELVEGAREVLETLRARDQELRRAA